MQRLSQNLVLMFILLAFTPASHAKDDGYDKDRAFLQQAMENMDASFNNKDADAYVRDTADDFIGVNKAGEERTHGKAARSAKLAHFFTRLTNPNAHSVITSISFDAGGATMVETSKVTANITIRGQQMPYTSDGIARDFWVKSGNKRIEKRSKTLTDRTTVNGIVVP